MQSATRSAPGVRTGADSAAAATQSQAMWRFLKNRSVTPAKLVEPLQQAAREGCAECASQFVLVMHDWCKLDFKRHASKQDRLQVTHEHDVGYDLTVSLAVDADCGAPLAPLAVHLRTANSLHSTATKPPQKSDHHLNQLAPTMSEIARLELGRIPVHIIDREADSLGHFRTWSEQGRLFLVRGDDRRVKWNGEAVLLREINAQLNLQGLFQKAGTARYHGQAVDREVAEVEVLLDGNHKTRVAGKQREIAGQPLTLRAVFVRLVSPTGDMLAEWMLLTNVSAAQANTAAVGEWYYFRWRIESYFKLLKSAGHELEYWQQTTGRAVLNRLLIASMACVFVWRLQRDTSEQAATLRKYLMKLSGRQTKRGVDSTASALLAGWENLLAMLTLLEGDVTLSELRLLAQNYSPARFLV